MRLKTTVCCALPALERLSLALRAPVLVHWLQWRGISRRMVRVDGEILARGGMLD